jgi:hypothetical protein
MLAARQSCPPAAAAAAAAVLAAGTCRPPGSPAQSWGPGQQALLLQVLALQGTAQHSTTMSGFVTGCC